MTRHDRIARPNIFTSVQGKHVLIAPKLGGERIGAV